MRHWMLILLTAGLLTGCSSIVTDDDELTSSEALVGSWVRVVDLIEIRLTIHEDGTFDVSYVNLAFEGTYGFDDNGLLVVRDSGCGNFSGLYSMTFTEGSRSLILGLVEDDCRTRMERWHGTWTRVGTG